MAGGTSLEHALAHPHRQHRGLCKHLYTYHTCTGTTVHTTEYSTKFIVVLVPSSTGSTVVPVQYVQFGSSMYVLVPVPVPGSTFTTEELHIRTI